MSECISRAWFSNEISELLGMNLAFGDAAKFIYNLVLPIHTPTFLFPHNFISFWHYPTLIFDNMIRKMISHLRLNHTHL
jgi:hypothetical protein